MPGKRPESQAKEFATFLRSFWGIWAGMSATLFPLSGALFAVIPVPADDAKLYAAFSTVLSLFAILVIFVTRDEIWTQHMEHPGHEYHASSLLGAVFAPTLITILIPRSVSQRAIRFFAMGVFFLVFYYFLFSYFDLGLRKGIDLVSLVAVLPYSLFFLSITLAFSIVALAEFMRATMGGFSEAPGSSEKSVLEYFLQLTETQWQIVGKHAGDKGNIFFILRAINGTGNGEYIRAEVTPEGKVVDWKELHRLIKRR